MSEFEEQKVSGDEEAQETEEDTSLANSDVTTKYQEAAKIVNATLAEILNLVRLQIISHIQVIILLIRSVFLEPTLLIFAELVTCQSHL
jgi:hypothetical protein